MRKSREHDCLAVLEQSRSFFWSAFEICEQITLRFFSAACTLAFHHIKAGKDGEASDMITTIKSVAEDRLSRDFRNIICLILRIARFYQSERTWDEARPHFEHAWAISLVATGPQSAQSKALEMTCENERSLLFPRSKKKSDRISRKDTVSFLEMFDMNVYASTIV